MLITSNYRDFYDVGMKMGVDKTIVYDRQTTAVKGKFPSISTYSNYTHWEGAVLGFCGKFYPFIYLVSEGKFVKFIWSLEEAMSSVTLTKNRYDYYRHSLTTEVGLKKFFERKYPDLEEIFHKYRTPIFGFEPPSTNPWTRKTSYSSLVVNPILKDIQFYRVKGPIETFQDIYMFISGVIGMPSKKMIEVSDKVKAASRGHDGEYSFKKQPGKRGRNRWR